MGDRVVQISEDFWNIRGTFRAIGLIDIGTQASLVRVASGGFVLLGAYTLRGAVARQVLDLTDQGRKVEAILNLHPFHTLHTRAVAEQFPEARLYGTSRHVEREPELRWETLHTDDAALHEQFAEDFAFTVPRGVDFISPNERLHFSSVIALHRKSGTMHVDDTLTWVSLPFVGGLIFHPTLGSVLERRAGAVADFRAWAEELVSLCEDTKRLCTAHARGLPPKPTADFSVADRVRQALTRVDKVLRAHEAKYG